MFLMVMDAMSGSGVQVCNHSGSAIKPSQLTDLTLRHPALTEFRRASRASQRRRTFGSVRALSEAGIDTVARASALLCPWVELVLPHRKRAKTPDSSEARRGVPDDSRDAIG